jgi:FAD/FMN-containing dehydrogenase
MTTLTTSILTPDHPRYDEARRVFNGAIDRRPALIVECADPRDVVEALAIAEEEGLEVAVRAGGHSGAGYGVNEGGLVIDVRPMKRIEVDLVTSVARVGAGVTWGELDAATQAHGLAVTGGRISSTGVAGLTLGSGSGWLERKLGLTGDNMLGATVVTADGDIVHASEHEHPDLFWGLRGGGGNFGVVTEFELQLHPVGPIVLGGILIFPWERAAEVLRGYRDVMAGAPDDLGGNAQIMSAPPAPFVPAELVGKPVMAMVVGAFAELDRAEHLVAPLRALGPAIDMVEPMPYTVLQSIADESSPAGMQNYWKAAFLDDLPDEAIDIAVEFGGRIPSPVSVVLFQPQGGAYARVDEDAIALSHRDAPWGFHALSLWPDPADTELNRAWTTEFADAMAPYGHGAAHPNYVSDDQGDKVRKFYGERSYARLVAVKDRWDPRNVFRGNQNIRPSGGGA